MKFEKKSNVKGAFVPRSALKLCGFNEDEELELHTLPGTAILIRQHMTAAELMETADAFTTAATILINHLIQSCESCDDCNDGDGCPYDAPDYINLPDYLRDEAGIPLNEKLCAQVDTASHSVTVQSAGYHHDLQDVPEDLLVILKHHGVCMGDLEEKLMTDAVIYG